MRLGVMANCFIQDPWETAVKKAKSFGLKAIVNAIALAGGIGVRILNGFSGCPGAAEDAKYPNWITCVRPPFFGKAVKWQWEKKIIPFWREMGKRLSDAGTVLAFEMHGMKDI